MSPQAQLDLFLDRFDPAIAALGRAMIDKLASLTPGASINVYDNYNALAVGFGPSDKASLTIFSVALYPRWVRVFFMNGASLDDPEGVLEGDASRVRSIVATGPEQLDRPEIRALIDQAMLAARVWIDPTKPSQLVIKSVSAKQRPRRP